MVLFCLMILLFQGTEAFSEDTQTRSLDYTTYKAIFISGKITDIAYHLRVLPVAYSARCGWPMVQKELATVKRLGCYRCASVDQVIQAAERHNARLILIEDGQVSKLMDWNWKNKFYAPLKKRGFEVHLISFEGGVPKAIRQVGAILQREQRANRLAGSYARMEKRVMKKLAGSPSHKKLLILQGQGRQAIRVETRQGSSEPYLLKPLSCSNVADQVKPPDTKVVKGFFELKNSEWLRLVKANPDVIVKTGNVAAVEKALAQALRNYPELARVTAIRDHTIYTLPAYIGSDVIGYPRTLQAWFDAINN